MPTYDYKCEQCETVVEEIRSINDESELLCGVCGDPMKQLIASSFSFILKGNGWAGRDQTEKKERTKKSSDLKKTMIEKESSQHFQ